MSNADKLDWLGAQGTATITDYRIAVACGNIAKIETEIHNYKIIASLMADCGLVVDNSIEKASRAMYNRREANNG